MARESVSCFCFPRNKQFFSALQIAKYTNSRNSKIDKTVSRFAKGFVLTKFRVCINKSFLGNEEGKETSCLSLRVGNLGLKSLNLGNWVFPKTFFKHKNASTR